MQIKQIILLLLVTYTFIGCGGGGGDSSSETPTATTITGQFIDAPVQGLGYTCSSGATGTTNSDGEYTCNLGDNVTFSLGGVEIGTASVQTTAITPYSLFPNSTTAAINLARLLQSLDTNSNDNIIVLDAALEANIPTSVDFTATDFKATIETALATTLISSQEAETNMNESIVALGGTVPTPTPIDPEPAENQLPTPPQIPTL